MHCFIRIISKIWIEPNLKFAASNILVIHFQWKILCCQSKVSNEVLIPTFLNKLRVWWNQISIEIVIKQSRRTNSFKGIANCSQIFREPIQNHISRHTIYLLLTFSWWWAKNYHWYTANKKSLFISDLIIMVFCGHQSSFVWLEVSQSKKKGFLSALFLSGKPETNLLVIHSKSSFNNLSKVLQTFIYLRRKNESSAI